MTQRLVGTSALAVLLFGLLSSFQAIAYEQATHAAMSREAMVRSQLNPATPDLLLLLGIVDLQTSLGGAYINLSDNVIAVVRSNDPTGRQYPAHFGLAKILDANQKSSFAPAIDSLPGWLMLGAIREDDVKYDTGALENNPNDDPGGAIDRVLNHFYDPYHDQPLTVVLPVAPPLTIAARDWALNANTGNDFSILRAREAQWRALTLKNAPALGAADLTFAPTADIPTKEALRIAYWATTFRALGDVVHLLQDMAQPQHTRNDPHSGRFCANSVCVGGHASFYEAYVDANVKGSPKFSMRERPIGQDPVDISEPILSAPITYAGYPVPRFADYRSFYASASGNQSVGGYGLANYSNQGFYSAGTNLGGGALVGDFPSPSPNGVGLNDLTMPTGTVKNSAGIDVPGVLVVKTGSVVDALNPSYTVGGIRLSSYGMFDQFVKTVQKSQYTLNHYNYDDQMRLLIPRAVAYSAGLLDYFFRGRMEIGLPDEGVYGIVDHAQIASQGPTDALNGFKGFKQIRLRLSNSTPAIITTSDGIKLPQPMTNGTIVAVLKFHRNACYSDRLEGEITDPRQLTLCRTTAEEIVASDPIKVPDQGAIPINDASPSSTEFTFRFANALPINAWDVVLQVVYRGQLGSEADAVVVATRDISEPTFVATFNDTDKILIAGTCHDPATVAATDALWNQLNSTCKPSSGGARYVTDACANVPLNVRLTSGSGASTVTVFSDASTGGDQRIAPRRFTRFVVLGELGAGTSMTLGFNNGPLLLRTSPSVRYPNYRAQQQRQVTFGSNAYSTTLSTVADKYVRHRGVKAWQGQYFVVDGATASINGACPDAQLDPLVGPERDPQSATILGWEED